MADDGGILSADEKGKVLEAAVHALESAILRSYPGYNEAAFRIERRRILVVAGVRHEYDVWIEIDSDIAKGYKPLFVFECKNWNEKVGKNEVIVFSEKIAAAEAQQGYFVAKAYSSDAIAQAAKDPRIKLLTAEELPGSAAALMTNLHIVGIDNQKRTISKRMWLDGQTCCSRATTVRIRRTACRKTFTTSNFRTAGGLLPVNSRSTTSSSSSSE